MEFSGFAAWRVHTDHRRLKHERAMHSDDSLRCRLETTGSMRSMVWGFVGKSVTLGIVRVCSDEEGACRQLECGDGAIVVGERDAEMSEDLCGGGPAHGFGR
jgi:hypothetical protein